MTTREQGTASVAMVGALAVLVAMLMTVVLAGGVALTQARVTGAADLAALAAAGADRDARVQGARDAAALVTGCTAARAVAARNNVSVDVCARGAGTSVVVTVSARPAAWPRPVRATARAGARAP